MIFILAWILNFLIKIQSFHSLQSGADNMEKQDQLTELLNSYSANGLPSLDSIVHVGVESYREDTFFMEDHWTQIVDDAEVIFDSAIPRPS